MRFILIFIILFSMLGCKSMGTLLDQVKSSANTVYYDKPIVAQICVAQAILESNLLNKPSKLASVYYNLFGIKKAGTKGLIPLQTKEVINGKTITVKAGFGWNSSVEDSVKQHRQIMSLKRYSGVMEAKTFDEAAYALVKGGYATDPSYAKKLIRIHNEVMN